MVDPLSYFSFQPVLHDWCNKGRGMCYPVCRMMHIKEPLLLIGKSSPCVGSGFLLSLSEWSFYLSGWLNIPLDGETYRWMPKHTAGWLNIPLDGKTYHWMAKHTAGQLNIPLDG